MVNVQIVMIKLNDAVNDANVSPQSSVLVAVGRSVQRS